MSITAEAKPETENRVIPAQERTSSHELWCRGWAIYYQNRDTIETEENIGKFVTIEVFTGDYEIGTDSLQTMLQLRGRHSDPANVTIRVGYTAAFARHRAELQRLPR